MIFIHGWNQSPSSTGSQAILNAYIINGNYNILMLDWSDAASGIYAAVQSRVNEVRDIEILFNLNQLSAIPISLYVSF